MYCTIKINEGKKKRGRPKKIFDYSSGNDEIFYNNFFDDLKRKKIPTETIDISNIVNDIFEKLFHNKENNLIKLKKIEEHPILNSLLNTLDNKKESKINITCDDIFISYIQFLINKTNKEYFIFSLSIILLLRECINKYKNIELVDKLEIIGEENNIKLPNFTEVSEGEQIPEICNEFLTEFLPSYKYFGLEFLNNFSEVKNLVQHFCFWLYENNFTSSKLIVNNKNN